MKKIILAAAIMMLFLFNATAGENQNAIMATTDDGRRVILLPNGTWHFIQDGGAPKVKTPSNMDKLWDEIVAYFSPPNYEIEKIDRASYFLQTKYKQKYVLQYKVTVIIKSDCTLDIRILYMVTLPSGSMEFYGTSGQCNMINECQDIEHRERYMLNKLAEKYIQGCSQ